MGQYVFKGSFLVVQSVLKHVKYFHLTWEANTACCREVCMVQESIYPWVNLHTSRVKGWWQERGASGGGSECLRAEAGTTHTAELTDTQRCGPLSDAGGVNCEIPESAINTTGKCLLLSFSPFDSEGITGWLGLGKASCSWFIKSYYSSSIIRKIKWW